MVKIMNFIKIKDLSEYEWKEIFDVVKNSYNENTKEINRIDPLGNKALFDSFCDHFNTLCISKNKFYEVYFYRGTPLFWQELERKKLKYHECNLVLLDSIYELIENGEDYSTFTKLYNKFAFNRGIAQFI